MNLLWAVALVLLLAGCSSESPPAQDSGTPTIISLEPDNDQLADASELTPVVDPTTDEPDPANEDAAGDEVPGDPEISGSGGSSSDPGDTDSGTGEPEALLQAIPDYLISLGGSGGVAARVPEVAPDPSDSPLRPAVLSFPTLVEVGQSSESGARIEIAFNLSNELSELIVSFSAQQGILVLPIQSADETPFPVSSNNTQATYYDLTFENFPPDGKRCYFFQGIDNTGLVSDKFETCFVRSTVADQQKRHFEYFDRQFVNGVPVSTYHALRLDNLTLSDRRLGPEPRQVLESVDDRTFAIDANRLLEIDAETGAEIGTITSELQASYSIGAYRNHLYLLDHHGTFSRVSYREWQGSPEIISTIPWEVLSYGDFSFHAEDQLFYGTVRFRELDNDYLFSIDPASGDYQIIGVTGARDICNLLADRGQLTALTCNGTVLLIDRETADTVPLHETTAARRYRVPTNPRLSYRAGDLQFPATGMDWRFWGGSDYHRLTYHSGRYFDDTHAYDLSKDLDVERLIAVTPVAPGDVVASLDRIGFTLVEHYGSLVLDDGTEHPKWYSGYMHLLNHSDTINAVNTDYVLGYLSDTGTSNNHLHFAIYIPEQREEGEVLVSIDVGTRLRDFVLPIHQWLDGCNWPTQTLYYDSRWWEAGELPCPLTESS